MSKTDREMFIEWLSIWTGYTKDYWEKQSDKIIESKYHEYLNKHGN